MEDVKKKEFDEELFPEELKGKKITAGMAYLSWLVVVPIIYSSESKFIHYHAKQGLVVALAETIYALLSILVVQLLKIICGYYEMVVWETFLLIGFICIFGTVSLVGILHVFLGKKKPVPTFGNIDLDKFKRRKSSKKNSKK